MHNKELVLRYFELSNSGDIEAISALLDEHASYSSDNVGLHFGKGNILAMKRTFFGGLSSQNWEIKEILEPSEGVFRIEFLFTATTLEGADIARSGVENIIVYDGKLRHIEVRNV